MNILILVILLTVSIGFNSILIYKTHKNKKERPRSYEVADLMHDLLDGKALVEVRRISPVDVFIKSPRQ